jgi:hypothetical protein
MGWHGADGRYRWRTALVLHWLNHAIVTSSAFRMRRLISSKGIAVGQRNTTRYCQLLYRMKSMTHSHNASFFVCCAASLSARILQ